MFTVILFKGAVLNHEEFMPTTATNPYPYEDIVRKMK